MGHFNSFSESQNLRFFFCLQRIESMSKGSWGERLVAIMVGQSDRICSVLALPRTRDMSTLSFLILR